MHKTGADRKKTIWVVDDSATDSERVRRLLEQSGHAVELFDDGAAALERLASGAVPDLLMLDWVMPGISGIEVCRYLRSTEGKLAQVPVLLLTARHGTQEIIQAFSSGANDYVSKPFVDEELSARVEALLNTKRLLERAEKAEADLRVLLNSAPDPIFVIDARGRVAFANEEGFRIFHFRRDKVIGEPLSDLIPTVNIPFALGAGPGELTNPDVRIGERLFSPSVRALPSDNTAAVTIVLRDVTDRRRAEAKRLDFYSVIAHELRTPLTSVMLRLQMALRGKHGVLPAGHLADLDKCDKSLRSLAGMINDFLELAKLEGGGDNFNFQPMRLDDVLPPIVDDFGALLEKGNLSLKTQNADVSGIVTADRRRISQIVVNLLGNAIKFTPPGGEITTSIATGEDYVEMSVTDTGQGIPPKEIPNLFDRFTRGNDSADTLGTGLGLMIVREIVEAHGGTIGVESEVGVGSKFWFRIPRSRSATSFENGRENENTGH